MTWMNNTPRKSYQQPFYPRTKHPCYLRTIKARYECKGCGQPGYGHRYCCKDETCNFHPLHKECATPSEDDSFYHALLQNRVLRFRESKPKKKRPCIACGELVLGFRYKSWHDKARNSHNPFWLLHHHFTQKAVHPRCAELRSVLKISDEISLSLMNKAPTVCHICDHVRLSPRTKGWAYVSSCGKYCYHVGCVWKIIKEYWRKQDQRDMRLSKIISKVRERIAKLALHLIVEALLGFALALIP